MANFTDSLIKGDLSTVNSLIYEDFRDMYFRSTNNEALEKFHLLRWSKIKYKILNNTLRKNDFAFVQVEVTSPSMDLLSLMVEEEETPGTILAYQELKASEDSVTSALISNKMDIIKTAINRNLSENVSDPNFEITSVVDAVLIKIDGKWFINPVDDNFFHALNGYHEKIVENQ